jgi:hypothetical protein
MEVMLAAVGVIVAVVAIGVPIWWDNRKKRIEEQLSKQKDIATTNTKRLQLLSLFQEAMKKNLQLVNQAEEELKEQVIFYNVDTTLLESTASLKYELIENIELNRLVDSVRYELEHFHRKIDLQLEIWISAQENSEQVIEEERILDTPNRRLIHMRRQIIGSIFAQANRIKQEITQVLKLIESETNL